MVMEFSKKGEMLVSYYQQKNNLRTLKKVMDTKKEFFESLDVNGQIEDIENSVQRLADIYNHPVFDQLLKEVEILKNKLIDKQD